MGPTFTRVQGGRNLSETLNGPLVAWVSPGTSWFATHLLPGSSNKERWVTSRAVNGTISAPTTLQLTYQHQYTVATNSLPPTGGSIATGPGWVDAGTTITLTQNASTGWKFEYWTGSGNGSYSGTSNTTAFLLTGPVVENATYYPSIIIVSGPDGSVTYSYGSEAGVVTSGTSITLYAPIGTGFAISENPSSILYKFNGWSQPDFGNSNPVLFRLTAPLSVSADFSFNYVEVGELAAPTILVLLAFMVLLLSRMRRSSVLAAVIIAIFATSVGAYAFYISPASTFAGPIGSQGSLTQGPSTSGIETASSASVSSSTTYTPAPPTLTGTSIRISSSTPVLSSRSEVTTVVSQSSISPRTSTAARTSTTATTSSTTSGISTSSAIVTTTPASTTVSSPSYSTTAATTTVTSTTLSTTISSTTLTSVTTASTTTTDTQSYKPINLTVILSLRLYYLNRTACYSPDGNPICGDSILWNVFDASGNCPTLVCFSEGGMNFTQRVTFLSCDWHLSYSNSMDQSPQLTTMTFSIATPDGTVLLFRSTTQVNTVIDGTWYPPCS